MRPRIIKLERVEIPQSNVEVLVHTPVKAKGTLRINKAYIDYVNKYGHSPVVDADLILKKSAQILHHLQDNRLRKRFKSHLKLSKKLIGYEAYYGLNPESVLTKPVRSFKDIQREYFVTVGRRITDDQTLSDDAYYDIAYLHLNKKTAPLKEAV